MRYGTASSGRTIALGIVLGAGVVIGLFWLVCGYWLNNYAMIWQFFAQTVWVNGLFPNGWNIFLATPLFWVIIAALMTITGFVLYHGILGPIAKGAIHNPYNMRRGESLNDRLGMATYVAAAIVFLAATVSGIVNIPSGAASYSGHNVIVVEDVNNLPSSLGALKGDLRKMPEGDECAYRSSTAGGDICLKQGEPEFSWVNRSASASGAAMVIGRNSSTDQNSDLLEETVSSVRDEKGYVWSGIVNGRRTVPMVGVSEWDGTGNPVSTCRFDGNSELNKSFNGEQGRNLSNTIALAYPGLRYDLSDVWGYCDGEGAGIGAPTIVIPAVAFTGYGIRSTDRFAGLIVVKGSSSGEPIITLDTEVSESEYPGSVYPASLVVQQRESLDWAAGWWSQFRNFFGFNVSSVETQQDNPSEYQLVNKAGVTYWVTPLRPTATDSQQIIGYSVNRSDAARVGGLNEQVVYLLNNGSETVVDMSRLESRVQDELNRLQANFIGSGGKLTEFLPVDNRSWQVFAERNGSVVYKIIIDNRETVSPTIYEVVGGQVASQPVRGGAPSLSPQPGQTKPEVATAACGKPLAQMSKSELSECIKRWTDELARR